MPSLDEYSLNYEPFDIMLIITFSFKTFTILIMIWKQCEIDVFFIDWERKKAMEDEGE
jgi:hypothetical protein